MSSFRRCRGRLFQTNGATTWKLRPPRTPMPTSDKRMVNGDNDWGRLVWHWRDSGATGWLGRWTGCPVVSSAVRRSLSGSVADRRQRCGRRRRPYSTTSARTASHWRLRLPTNQPCTNVSHTPSGVHNFSVFVGDKFNYILAGHIGYDITRIIKCCACRGLYSTLM